MSRHLRRRPWWRRPRVLAQVLGPVVTAAVVGAGVYGSAPVGASEAAAQVTLDRPVSMDTVSTSRQVPAEATAPAPVTISAGVAHSVANLADASVDVAAVSVPAPAAVRQRSLTGWGRSPRAAPLVWRSTAWRLAQVASVQVPYGSGDTVSRSLIELDSRTNGVSIWVLDARPPAGADASGLWRDSLTSIESKLATELSSAGAPVVFLGDRVRPVAGAGVHFGAAAVSRGLVAATGTVD